MKILMMSNTFTPVVGGLERSIQLFSAKFKEMGHEVKIVAPVFEGSPADESDVIRIPAIQKFNRTDFSVNLPIPGLLSNFVKTYKPDVIHSHHPFLVGDMAVRLSRQFQIPLVFTHHTMFEQYTHYLPIDNERVKRFVIELAVGYANLADQVVVPCESIRHVLQQRRVESPIEIVPTGIDLKRWQNGNRQRFRQKLNIPEQAFVVGYVGRLSLEKNVEFLARAVGSFLALNPTAYFCLLGQGAQEEELKKIFNEQGVSARVHHLGVLENQELADGYYAMDVFAFTSKSETQGIVLMEALACGIPVVALRAPGAQDIIRDFHNGRLIDAEREVNFVEAFQWIKHIPSEEYNQLKAHAKETAAFYSMEECAQRMLRLYERVRLAKNLYSLEKLNVWQTVMNRIKTEWDILKNFAEASEAAFKRSGKDDRLFDKSHLAPLVRKVRKYSNKSEWGLKFLGLSREVESTLSKGLVLIQIDGFSQSQLKRAVKNNEVPFLKKLIKDEQYDLYPFYSGLPSSTPSVQAELMYGVKQVVPAFSYFDKKAQKIFRMYDADAAIELENRLKSQGEGLLKGGSSYSNIYTGQAKEAHFCAGLLGWNYIWKDVNPWNITFFIFAHFLTFLRIIILLAWELIVGTVDCLYGILKGEDILKELKFIPTRLAICVLLRELIALNVRMDIARGLPIIHLNLIGYDEHAHQRGPSSRFAHRALRGVDRSIESIYREALRSPQRNYDVWVYSDHGQESVTPYLKKHGVPLHEAVCRIYKEFNQECKICQSHEGGGIQFHRARYLGARMIKAIFPFISLPAIKPQELIVTAIGPTANIYFPKPMTFEDKIVFAKKLVDDAFVPFVLLADEKGKVLVFNKRGQFVLPEHAKEVIGENHPFLSSVTQDLIDLCYHPESGDMTLSGWDPNEPPISFALEKGAHAGPGKEETHGFAMLPSDILNLFPSSAEQLKKTANDSLMEIWLSQLRPSTQVVPEEAHADCPHLTPLDLRELSNNFLKENCSVNVNLSAASADFKTSLSTKTIRVMTYNVHSCIGMDGKDSPERIARVIGRHEPDIVGLQELDTRRLRTKGADQPQIIARDLEMIFHFHPSIAMEEEQYGDALLTRLPMQLIKAGPLPGLPSKPKLEPRGAIWCSIKVEDIYLQVFNAHLGLLQKERLNQVEALLSKDWIGRALELGPVVLIGDFNALPGSIEYKRILEVLKDVQLEIPNHEPQATWFSHYPVTRIDHVFISHGLKVKSVHVPRTQLDRLSSDHLPLIVDLKIES